MSDNNTTSEMNWDLTSYFPKFAGSEMLEFKDSLKKDIERLKLKASRLSPLSDDNSDLWEEAFLLFEDVMNRYSHISSYVGCLSSVDSRNEDYLKEDAEMSSLGAELSKVEVELEGAFKDIPDKVFETFLKRPALETAKYYFGRVKEQSEMRMSLEKEVLAAELSVDGINAWGRLYDNVSGKLEFDMVHPDGREERLPISQRRSLMEKSDRAVRKAAFEGGNRAWESVEDIASAALNAISGTRLTLNQNRGIDHFLDVALFQSAITHKTLDAMFEAIYSEIELPRAILKLKAKSMGRENVAWYDLGSSLPITGQSDLDWNEAKELVRTSFKGAYSPLGDYLKHMYDSKWIEWEPRAGKRPGGFCTGSMLTGESRIFMTYNKALGDTLTLAHEAGHAFHSHIMRDLRPYAQLYPMTLAESASTFGEMILAHGLLDSKDIGNEQKAQILDMEIGHGAIYLLDIPVRFEFEKKLYEERSSGELTVSRLKQLMTETQRNVFGDVLEEGGEDPLFWASKLHFYITGVTFYNFPYTFGYLLSRGLYSMFDEEGDEFLPRYEQFLLNTGSDTAPNVAKKTLGRDLESPEFWVDAIRTLEKPLNLYKEILPEININTP